MPGRHNAAPEYAAPQRAAAVHRHRRRVHQGQRSGNDDADHTGPEPTRGGRPLGAWIGLISPGHSRG
jgi:hypothetical protein